MISVSRDSSQLISHDRHCAKLTTPTALFNETTDRVLQCVALSIAVEVSKCWLPVSVLILFFGLAIHGFADNTLSNAWKEPLSPLQSIYREGRKRRTKDSRIAMEKTNGGQMRGGNRSSVLNTLSQRRPDLWGEKSSGKLDISLGFTIEVKPTVMTAFI